jgi:antitoxin HigA-1
MSIARADVDAGRVDFSDLVDPDAPPLDPVHPGDVLLHDFMEPLDLSAEALARELHVATDLIEAIARGERGLTADSAMRLARYFGTSVELWLGLQKSYEIEVARRQLGEQIAREVQPRAAA